MLIEGYKREPIPKIEARRLEAPSREPLRPRIRIIVAIAADHGVDDAAGFAVFDLDDTTRSPTLLRARLTLGLPSPQPAERTSERIARPLVLPATPHPTIGPPPPFIAERKIERAKAAGRPGGLRIRF